MRLRQKRGPHRRGDANLRLAPALGARERRVVLAEVAHDRGGEQALADLLLWQLAATLAERVDDRGNDAGRAARGRSDDQMPAGILLRARQGIGRDDANTTLAEAAKFFETETSRYRAIAKQINLQPQ